MDIFSEIIVAAVDKVKNAVVKIDKYAHVGGKERIAGSGSGFVFSSDGLILTNAHVIENSSSLNVTLLDGNEFAGEVTGIDKDTDMGYVTDIQQELRKAFCLRINYSANVKI